MTKRRKSSGNNGAEAQDVLELTPFQKALLKEANRKVKVRIDGETKEISAGEVIAGKMFQTAASGSPHALGHVSRSVNEAQRIEQARIRDDIAKGERIKDYYTKQLNAAVRAGNDPTRFIPHPDDIIIDHSSGWDFRPGSPLEPADLKGIRETISIRDALLLQSALDQRLDDRPRSENEQCPMAERPGSGSQILATMLNDGLFERFRLSKIDIVMKLGRYERTPKRDLLKSAYRAWQTAGRPKPRGSTIPPWSQIGDQLTSILKVMVELSDEYQDKPLPSEAVLAGVIARRLSG